MSQRMKRKSTGLIRKSCIRSSMLTKIFLRRKERHGEGDFETEMLKKGFRVVYYGEGWGSVSL